MVLANTLCPGLGNRRVRRLDADEFLPGGQGFLAMAQ